jgi:hypothetical protein
LFPGVASLIRAALPVNIPTLFNVFGVIAFAVGVGLHGF